MEVSDLDYHLPEPLIAQQPCPERDAARLLVVDRQRGSFEESSFRELPRFLRAGDCVVLNDTQVIRARLHGRKSTGGQVELFLLKEEQPGIWTSLVRPSARVRPGTTVNLAGDISVEVGEVLPEGRRRVHFSRPDVLQVLESIGEIPLPPYIHRDIQEDSDLRRYQTVFAEKPGAVAAPTAGLHYTPALLEQLSAEGIAHTRLTLHVGYGTFKPITAAQLAEHHVEAEEFDFPEATAAQLNATRQAGGKILAVGTTATRVLETQHQDGRFVPGSGVTDTYIYPPYEFKGVDMLQTNFHLPRSSLLALVCAFAGRDLLMDAYHHAIKQEFRFYSYGDTMLIL